MDCTQYDVYVLVIFLAMTAYSPCVIALNDMLRQQLELTTQFMTSQKHLHRIYIGRLEPSKFKYTTLKDTKAVGRMNLYNRIIGNHPRMVYHVIHEPVPISSIF